MSKIPVTFHEAGTSVPAPALRQAAGSRPRKPPFSPEFALWLELEDAFSGGGPALLQQWLAKSAGCVRPAAAK